MLNIREPVPLMEPVPTNSGIPGITSDTIPEFSTHSQTPTPTLMATTALTPTPTLMATPTLPPTTCNSGTEFRELGRTGIERNCTEFLGIPSNSGRFRNRFLIDLILEFRAGIGTSLNG